MSEDVLSVEAAKAAFETARRGQKHFEELGERFLKTCADGDAVKKFLQKNAIDGPCADAIAAAFPDHAEAIAAAAGKVIAKQLEAAKKAYEAALDAERASLDATKTRIADATKGDGKAAVGKSGRGNTKSES